jgi:hypothetical protein
MTMTVTVDVAGGQMGGAARLRDELDGYLRRTAPDHVKLIGLRHRLGPAWLVRREAAAARTSRRVALNNVGFLTPGGERRTLLTNALHFLTPGETAALDRGLRALVARQRPIVHSAARRSDVLIAPCTAMAERVATALPDTAGRLTVRMHPVSADQDAPRPGGSLILCPVLFAPYKQMADRLAEWLDAVDATLDEAVQMIVTAGPGDVPPRLARSARFHFAGRLSQDAVRRLRSRSRAVYFPTALESFGCALAEARVGGQPVIARDTPQNREIAGAALCGYAPGDPGSLRQATETALTTMPAPDPGPFHPDAYFDWLLGAW